MLKFAIKTLSFIFPLIILFAVIEYNARSLTSNFSTRREKLEQNLDQAQIIITGNSHAFYGIKPELLGRPSFNVSYAGQDLYYDTRILLKYLPQATQVKLVIITITYNSFEYSLQDSEGSFQTNFYMNSWEFPDKILLLN